MNKEEKPSWAWTCHDTTQRKLRGLPHCHRKAQDGEHHSVGCVRDLDSRPWVRQAGIPQAWQCKRISNLQFFQTQQEHMAPLHIHHSFSFCLLSVNNNDDNDNNNYAHIELSLQSKHWVNCFVYIVLLNPHIIISILYRKKLSKVTQLVRGRADIWTKNSPELLATSLYQSLLGGNIVWLE